MVKTIIMIFVGMEAGAAVSTAGAIVTRVHQVAVLPRSSALFRERGSLWPSSAAVVGAAMLHVAYLEAPSHLATAVNMPHGVGMHQFGAPLRDTSFTAGTITPPKAVAVAAAGWVVHFFQAAWEEREAPPALPALQQLP